MVALAIVVVVVLIALVGIVFSLMRSSRDRVVGTPVSASFFPTRPLPEVQEFHVKGDTASVRFSVPLGASGASEQLTALLSAAAVEHVRGLVRDGLPLEEVKHITVLAMSSGDPQVVVTVHLPSVGVLPDVNMAVLSEASGDPIAAVQKIVADSEVATGTSGSTALEALSEFVVLSDETEAHLRSAGVDPDSMSLSDLVLGLLRSAGYHVGSSASNLSTSLAGRGEVYDITNNGRKNVLAILPHVDGSHPELDDSVLALLAVEVAQSNPAQAILVTDKYSPYSMYEREKREKRCVFVTRERLQAFVDSFDTI